jgi:glycosyltransferase involved in cell wall biosynthesis
MMEKKILGQAQLMFFPSDWAAESAVRDYQADSKRVSVAPFGANLDDYPNEDCFNPTSDRAVCRLLFVGVDWKRKGGDIALSILKRLCSAGLRAELDVVGCEPPVALEDNRVKLYGFLNKSKLDERRLIEQLFSKAAFFILPSRQEAFGIVFCEASAYGTPSLATRTGGVPTAVKDGVNGFTFNLDAGPDLYANKIMEYWSDETVYMTLRRSTREYAKTTLTWDAWGQSVSSRIQEWLQQGG